MQFAWPIVRRQSATTCRWRCLTGCHLAAILGAAYTDRMRDYGRRRRFPTLYGIGFRAITIKD
jgi:hypothetical protein